MILNLRYTKRGSIAGGILLASLVAFVTLLSQKSPAYACSGTCPSECYTSPSCGCTGPGGCRNIGSGCVSGEYKCGTSYCCDNCDDSCGSCSCTPAACSGYYSVTSNNGCSSTTNTCTKYYQDSCCGSCGTESRTCWLVKYTLTYTAGSNGSLTGTTSQSVCRGSNGTAVTAVPNTGYSFSQWSDSSTANPRTDTNVTASLSVTASFVLNNVAPTAPTSLLAEGATNPTGVTDTTPEFSAIFNDPNTSDTSSVYQIQVNTSSAFTGTSMWDSGLTSMTATANGARSPNISYAGTTLSLNGTTYYWRIRFQDSYGATGAWSSAANFTMNTTPTAPTSLLAEGVATPTQVSDLTPEFSAIFNDPDTSNTGTYYQIQVNTSSGFSGTSMWDSGLTAMTATANGARSPNISYAGTTLSQNGSTYYWRIKFADNYGTTSPWSSVSSFTMNTTPTAPTVLWTEGSVTPTGVSDTTPEFSAIFNDPNTSDTGTYYQVQVNTASDFSGTSMWDSGLTSMTATTNGSRSPDISYAGTTLSLNGTTYYWRIRFADNLGATGAWSSASNFTMNIYPSAPTSLLTEGATNPISISDTTPEFSAIFNDPDTSDTGTRYQIQVNTASDFSGTSMWDSGLTSMTATTNGSRSPDISYAGTILPLDGTKYYWRIRFANSYGTEGTWSAASNFTMNDAPTDPTSLLTEGTTNPINVTDTTPEFSAIFNDPDTSDTAIYYQIQVNTTSEFNGTTMWDSTKTSLSPSINNGARSQDISYAGTTITLNGTLYYWRIKFWDNNNNEGAWSDVATFLVSGAPYQPTALQTNDMTNPSALTRVPPYFSAIYSDINTNPASAYEIEVNAASDFSGAFMWDSGKTSTTIANGQRSSLYYYAGTALSNSDTTYYWRIRFWDSDEQLGPWSETAQFADTYSLFQFGGLQMGGIKLD